jgi:hypothetical protein
VAPTTQIKEIVEAHILQIVEFSLPLPDNKSEDEATDIFEVFAAQKRKQEGKAAKLPELIEPATQTTPTPPPTIQAKPLTTQNKPGPQYCYQATVEDQCLVSELQDWLMGGKLIQTTPAHVLATSPAIHKELIEKLQVHWVEVNTFKSYPELNSHPSKMTIPHEPNYSLPLLKIDVAFNGSITEPAVLDPGSQIVVIRKDLVQEVNACINPS